LWYFTYWAPSGWSGWDDRAIVDATGAPTDLYEPVKRLNRAILDAAPVLLRLTSVDVMHTRPLPGHRAFVPGTRGIAAIRARDALVAFFERDDAVPYVMIVNKIHGGGRSARDAADTIDVEFASDVRRVDAVSWLDGVTGPIALAGRTSALR